MSLIFQLALDINDTMALLKHFIGKLKTKVRSQAQRSYLMPTYARLPIQFVRGDGCTLWDSNGNTYLDALGGIAVCFLGHSHPAVSDAISAQSKTLMHTSNLFEVPEQEQFGQRFCAISGMESVFMANSGTEANEGAIKITRRFATSKGIENPIIVTANGSFHGRSFGALSASGNAAIQKGFAPLLPGFEHVAYNDLAAVRALQDKPNVVAVMIEPIQGEAGIIIPDDDYLSELRKICDQSGWLLITDEIQSGMGRTGKWFAYQHAGILPDVVTAAKALGNGYPIGVCAAQGIAATMLNMGAHGTTFGGNPLACKVGLTVIDTIEQDGLIAAASQMGAHLKDALRTELDDLDNVVGIRAKGLMLGIELRSSIDGLAQRLLTKGLVANVTGAGKVIRMLPSALITEQQCQQVAQICSEVLREAQDAN